MYAIGSMQSGNTSADLHQLNGLNQNLFRISGLGYVRNTFRGLHNKQPFQAGLYHAHELAYALEKDIGRGTIDVIIVHLIRMTEYARPFKAIPKILDMTDSIHLHYARMPRLPLRAQGLAALIERNRLSHYETDVSMWFDNVLLASPLDIDWLQRKHTKPNLTLIPTGIEISSYPFHEGPFDPDRIVFVGKLDYLPNTDAVLYFAREILPIVRRMVPSAQFVVAGWNPPRAVQKLARQEYIKVLPNVSDIRPEVAKSAVSVAPMRFGAGIQVKILESLALGTPAVATGSVVGAFGKEGRTVIPVGANPHEFAEKVVSVLKNRSYRDQLRRAGRHLIESNFQWHQVLRPLDRILDGIAEKRFENMPELSMKGELF